MPKISEPQKDPRFLKERERLRLAVADVTLCWAEVENSLCRLLGDILSDHNMASAVLFSPTSLDARIAIVDSAFQALMRRLPKSSETAVKECWDVVMKRLSNQKATRNKVAHGALVVHTINGKAYPRLTAPILDLARFQAALPSAPHQPTGLSAHDLEQSTATLEKAQRDIATFARFVKEGQGRDLRALERELHLLQAQIRSDAPPRIQNPPDNEPPAEQSPG